MSWPMYQQQQYPAQVPQMPNPFGDDGRLRFVDGTAGMRAYRARPGSVVALFDTTTPTMWLKATDANGVPVQTVRYHLTEEQEPDEDVGTRMAAMEEEIRRLKEELDNANAVPDVRAAGTGAAPRHVDTGGGAPGEPAGGAGWQPGGGGDAADGH